MKKTYSRRAVFLRGALYVGTAVLTDLVPMLASDEPIKWPWVIAKLTLAALLIVRAFIDRSAGQQQEDESK